MAFAGKTLADGTVSSSQAQIYKVPKGSKAVVKNLFLYNANVTDETVNVYVRRGPGTIRQVYRAVLQQYESVQMLTEALPLSSEDSLYADTTSSLTYVISGATE